MSKYIELARKPKELADKGVGGERVNAEDQLRRLMEKHGFTLEELESERIGLHRMSVAKDSLKLFMQVASTITGKDTDIYGSKKEKNVCYIRCTAQQAIEVESKFEFYLRNWEDQLQMFYEAFVRANNLYPKDGTGRSLSLDELERYLKMERMAKSIEKGQYRKQISG